MLSIDLLKYAASSTKAVVLSVVIAIKTTANRICIASHVALLNPKAYRIDLVPLALSMSLSVEVSI